LLFFLGQHIIQVIDCLQLKSAAETLKFEKNCAGVRWIFWRGPNRHQIVTEPSCDGWGR